MGAYALGEELDWLYIFELSWKHNERCEQANSTKKEPGPPHLGIKPVFSLQDDSTTYLKPKM